MENLNEKKWISKGDPVKGMLDFQTCYVKEVFQQDQTVANVFGKNKKECVQNVKLIKFAPMMYSALLKISNISEDKGTPRCTYGNTEFDSLSVVYGYNLALEHVKDLITKDILKF